ncbi:hypothetical protein CCMA1212_003320, partial [Trichoderma ghanense]
IQHCPIRSKAHLEPRLQRNGLAPLDRLQSARLSSTRGRRTDPGLGLAAASQPRPLSSSFRFSISFSLSPMLVSALLLFTS